MLTAAFGESTMSRTQVQLWYKWFKEGREDANEMLVLVARSEAVEQMILANCRIFIRVGADDVAISFGSCQAILKDVRQRRLFKNC